MRRRPPSTRREGVSVADVERPVKERLLSAVADLQHYITHDVDIDLCAACPRWDELQDAAMSTVSEIEVLRAQLAETEEDLKAVADNYEMLKKTHGELEAEVGRFYAGFGRVKPLYIPSLLAGLLLVSGCTQIPCDTLWLSVICGVDPRYDHKYKRLKPSDLVPAKPHKTRR